MFACACTLFRSCGPANNLSFPQNAYRVEKSLATHVISMIVIDLHYSSSLLVQLPTGFCAHHGWPRALMGRRSTD